MKKLAALIFLVLVVKASAFAAPAQNVAMDPPPAGESARQCLDCHRQPNLATNEGAYANRAMCNECHAKEACARTVDQVTVSLKVDPKGFEGSRHEFIACAQCHPDVARSPHSSLKGVECLSCHPPHGEAAVKAPHLRVRCEACHNKSRFVALDAATGLVGLAKKDDKGRPISLADHSRPDLQAADFCARCHHAQNRVGAPAMALPAKGVICFLCHSASVSLGSLWFGLALVIFLAGMMVMVLFWLKGSVQGREDSLQAKIAEGSEHLWQVVFSRRIWKVVKVVFFDVILQRRLLKESVQRWFTHSLIYLSILARLGLALFTWLVYQIWPASGLAAVLMDKDSAFTAFVNDLLGLFILVGVILAALQRWIIKPRHVAAEWQDNLALMILGLLAILGFKLEAMRIIMSQVPASAAVYSFVAYPLAGLWSHFNLNWSVLYGYLWYAHGILAALFVAYLPFGKMKHVFSAPLTLIMNRDLEKSGAGAE
jgi:nitrate reductase gamma subunit